MMVCTRLATAIIFWLTKPVKTISTIAIKPIVKQLFTTNIANYGAPPCCACPCLSRLLMGRKKSWCARVPTVWLSVAKLSQDGLETA